uniref:Secreted protein n=1 Tax=Steinernema glaseri TaxID=37863 RepID=A0A1I7YIM5_9BILA
MSYVRHSSTFAFVFAFVCSLVARQGYPYRQSGFSHCFVPLYTVAVPLAGKSCGSRLSKSGEGSRLSPVLPLQVTTRAPCKDVVWLPLPGNCNTPPMSSFSRARAPLDF